jgi:hypothetical protein
LYTPPVTPWELVMPEKTELTVRRQVLMVLPVTGVKS